MDEELRIRQLAYHIWEAEGRPDGQHELHWQMACKLVAAERGESAQPARVDAAAGLESEARVPTPGPAAAKRAPAKRAAKPAPSRLIDDAASPQVDKVPASTPVKKSSCGRGKGKTPPGE